MRQERGEALTGRFREDEARIGALLRTEENFDLTERTLTAGETDLKLWYANGLTRTDSLEKVIAALTIGASGDDRPVSAVQFAEACLPVTGVKTESSMDALVTAVLEGCTVMLGSTFGGEALVMDLRLAPGRASEEPENDKVMRGSRDGFVENLATNVALIRRRIRTPALTVSRARAGESTRTDLAVLWIEGRADDGYVRDLLAKMNGIDTDSLVLGHQSIAEAVCRKGWLNPFPKTRATERPDTAAAALLEGGVIVLCDNSPEALLFPVSLFHFLQETDDFYFPPLTGTYLRILRHLIFWMTMIVTPLWYLAQMHADTLPSALAFLIPQKPGALPILFQLLLTEFALDGLKLASLNTPDVLASSLSVVGGLLLGDFAVTVGWGSSDVILYRAFVAIAIFTQSSYELGYAFKYLRILTLLLTAVFDWPGLAAGVVLAFLLALTNRTLDGRRRYLWPLIPFDGPALARLVFRLKKRD